MVELGDEGPTLDTAPDIGVGAEPSVAKAGRATQPRRVLPRWAGLVIALLVGWVLGTLMNAQGDPELARQDPAEPRSVEEPATGAIGATQSFHRGHVEGDHVHLEGQFGNWFTEPDPTAVPAPVFQEGPVEAVYEQLGGRPDDADLAADAPAIVSLQATTAGDSIPPNLTVIQDGVATQIELDRDIAGEAQSAVGQGERRSLGIEDKVVFMARDAVMIFDPFAKTEPVEVAQAHHLLRGSEAGRVWAVTAGALSVLDIDVRTQLQRAEYDLTNIGSPLASYSGGLVVAPANPSLGKFALWSPARGIEKLWSMHEQTTFIGAAGNVLVVHTPQGLAAYNAVTGSLAQSDFVISPRARRQPLVSTDGSRIALVASGSTTELPIVTIIDTSTGEQIDAFDAAFEWQLHWASNDELLFMLPAADEVSVLLRDTTTGNSTVITDLAGPNLWVTLVG